MRDEDHQVDSNAQLAYRTYLDERKVLVDAELEVAGRFDKGLLTMSGGTLFLSMAFIKEIASKPHLTWTLLASWILLAVTVCAMLTSLLTSQSALRFQRKILDDELESKESASAKNLFAVQTNLLNAASIVSFIVAIVFLSVFVYANMPGDK